jgi:hypothetical protein
VRNRIHCHRRRIEPFRLWIWVWFARIISCESIPTLRTRHQSPEAMYRANQASARHETITEQKDCSDR